MAFLSRMYRPYSAPFADSALTIAKAMYETAKLANKGETAPDYTGDITLFDDMGLAAVALLWATGEDKYLQEAVYKTGMPTGKGGICPSADYSATYATTRFEGGFFGCGTNGMLKNGGPTDYGSVQSLALYSFAKLILSSADTAARYGIRPGQRDTLLLRSINQMAGPLWGTGNGATVVIPTGDQYNPTRLTYDTTWYAMGIGYGKSGWWNKYQFGNLADLYMFYDMTSLVEGRAIVDKPGTTDWKRKEVLQVLLGGLNYMFGTNALDLSYIYGVGRRNPMHPHHRAANPEGKNVPGAYYNYTIPVGGLYGGLLTGPSNTEALVEKFGGPVGQTEANCPDAQVAVIIPLMGLSSETPDLPPKAVVKVLYTTDTSATISIDLDKWGTVRIGYGLDSSLATQILFVPGGDTGGTFKIQINGLTPATQYYFHVVATDLKGPRVHHQQVAQGCRRFHTLLLHHQGASGGSAAVRQHQGLQRHVRFRRDHVVHAQRRIPLERDVGRHGQLEDRQLLLRRHRRRRRRAGTLPSRQAPWPQGKDQLLVSRGRSWLLGPGPGLLPYSRRGT